MPADPIVRGICLSGMYDMKRRGSRRAATTRSDARGRIDEHDPLSQPTAYAGDAGLRPFETPEFRRQGRDFAAAVKATGKRVTLVEGKNYAHMEMGESLANPYGPDGRVALAMMGLGRACTA